MSNKKSSFIGNKKTNKSNECNRELLQRASYNLSKLDCLFIITVISSVIILIYARSHIIGIDTSWHILTGNFIRENNTIPVKDTYTIHKDLNFMAHEWLWDIAMSLINSSIGLKGIYLITLIITLIGYVYSIKSSNYPIDATVIVFMLTLVGFHKSMLAIPDTLGVIVLIILFRNLVTSWGTKKSMVLNAILVVLLANIHGGMLLAVIIQQVYISTLNILKTKFNKECIKTSLLYLTETAMFSCINPYGIKIYHYGIMVNTIANKYTTDWEPFSTNNILQIFIIVLLVIIAQYGYIIGVQNSKSKKEEQQANLITLIINNTDLCIMLMYTVALLRYQRTINMFTYAFIIYSTKYIHTAVSTLSLNKKLVKATKVSITLISLLLSATILLQYNIDTTNKFEPTIDKPTETLEEYIHKYCITNEMIDEIHGKRVFNSIGLGGMLEYVGEKAFIDGRLDPFLEEYGNPNIYEKYMKAIYNIDELNRLTEYFEIDYLLLDSNALTTRIVKASPDWEEVWQCRYSTLFKRVK